MSINFEVFDILHEIFRLRPLLLEAKLSLIIGAGAFYLLDNISLVENSIQWAEELPDSGAVKFLYSSAYISDVRLFLSGYVAHIEKVEER